MSQSISLLKVILNSGSSPAEPWLSSPQLLDAPENKAIQGIWALPPLNPRPVAAICHGPWVISDAGLTRGKRVTGWLATRRDLENAGATFIDEAAVTDGKIITSRGPLDLAAFVYAIDDLIEQNRR